MIKFINEQYIEFIRRWDGVLKPSDKRTLELFLDQMREEISKPKTSEKKV